MVPRDRPNRSDSPSSVNLWAAGCGFHEAVANHFSLAVSNNGDQFLVNPAGRHFSRMRASDLLLIDIAGTPQESRADLDPTAIALHGAIHRQVPQARCVLHVH